MSNAVFEIDPYKIDVYVALWPAVILAILIIVGLGLLLSRTRHTETIITSIDQLTQRVVRRHSRRGGTHPTTYDATTILPHISALQLGRHWAITNDQWHDADHPLDSPTMGRRAAGNPFRTIVPSDWRPPIGSDRIRCLDERTVEVVR